MSSFSVSVYGGRGVHVEGHKGVSFMSGEEMIFKTKKGVLSIRGMGLKILEIGENDAYITGVIKGVDVGGIDG